MLRAVSQVTKFNQPLFRVQYCFFPTKVNGNELRKGDVINLKGKVVEVVKTGFCKTGARGSAYTQLELKDIDTGKKREDRVRTTEGIEVLSTETKTAYFSEQEFTGKIKLGKPEGKVIFELEEENEDGEDEFITIDAAKLPFPQTYYAER